ncbi:MAG: MBL fold metallo-hydrolase [Bacteroidota bacterium]|jgi:L-ascorbate metabolism protein UlaG (beta-lactamase superfamily)
MNHQHIHWLGHSSFRIEDGATQLYIDPWKLAGTLPSADVVFLTHAHYDHFSVEDIARIKKDTTVFFAPKDIAYQLKGTVIVVSPGESYHVGELKIKTVHAYNIGKKFHPKQNNWVGYVIALSTGERIYHSGDTDLTPEMRGVVTEFALLPCGGTYTMSGKEAGDAANIFKPRAVIPMHWGDIVGTRADAEEVQKIFKGETIIKSPEKG